MGETRLLALPASGSVRPIARGHLMMALAAAFKGRPQPFLCFTSLLVRRDVNSTRAPICARPPRAGSACPWRHVSKSRSVIWIRIIVVLNFRDDRHSGSLGNRNVERKRRAVRPTLTVLSSSAPLHFRVRRERFPLAPAGQPDSCFIASYCAVTMAR